MSLKVVLACSLIAGSAAFLSTPAAPASALGRKATSQRLTPSLGLRSPLLPAKLSARRGAVNGVLSLAAKVKAEYIWIGGRGGGGDDYRSKTRILDEMPKTVDDLPLWNYDGSSTGQAPGEDSEVYLKPAFMCKDPVRAGESILVLCEMLNPDMTPIPTNTRTEAAKIFAGHEEEEPWFGIEQEYTLFQDGVPLGWPKSTARPSGETSPLYQFGYPGAQGPYYCAVGYDVSFGRNIMEEHLDQCLNAGLNIGGTNGEVMPGQWEYQIGPCVGIAAGDELHMSRYLLHRVCEENGIIASFDPKPIPGPWNGAGCHTNFSTKKMREDGGMKEITKACDAYGVNHQKHIKLYGVGNERRLTGDCETNSIDSYKYGVADRGASIRIPRFTDRDGKGYLEDRRPASNMDPYVVTALIFDTGVLKGDTTAFDNAVPSL